MNLIFSYSSISVLRKVILISVLKIGEKIVITALT